MPCTERYFENGQLLERPCNAQEDPPPTVPSLKRGEDAVPFLKKIRNFAVAAAQHVAAGMPTASDEEIIRRHDICQQCEFFKDNSCSKCGCPIYRDKKFISKLAWADQKCPIGKW